MLQFLDHVTVEDLLTQLIHSRAFGTVEKLATESSITVNSLSMIFRSHVNRCQHQGTKERDKVDKKRESMLVHGKMNTKAQSSRNSWSPPECASVTAIHCVQFTDLARGKITRAK